MRFRRVRAIEEAYNHEIKLTLFRCENGIVRGWYIGPITGAGGRLQLPHCGKEERLLGSIAVARAMEASSLRSPVCIVDPDDLWDAAWET